ncbi:MAG: MFS transporter, partial [Herbaspirillum sp.]|nr:MFS transporter [Herbaspirillum sp.]
GPFVIGWLKNKTGSYTAGLYVVAASLALSAVVTLMLSRQTRRPDGVAKPSHGH